MTDRSGRVWLVGAGPGDPGLLTVAGLRALREAEVVVFDRLAPGSLLSEVPEGALLIDVGKRAGEHSKTQAEINQLLVEHGRQGRRVVRLKGGDPFVFGRGGEEAVALAEAGVPVTVIPGVTSAIAGPALAGIPVTHRGVSGSFAVVSGQSETGDPTLDEHWRGVVSSAETVVVLMGATKIAEIAAAIVAAGRDGDTPAAVIERATHPDQRLVESTLAAVAADSLAAGISSPATLVVGGTVRLAAKTRISRPSLPLEGRTIAVTGAARGGPRLGPLLEEAGARPVVVPLIAARPIDPGPRWVEILEQLARGGYRWIAFSSARGVDEWFDRLAAGGLDARALAGTKVCAVGPATAAELLRRGIRADLVPPTFSGAAAAEAMASADPSISGRRVLLPRAQDGADGLPDGLREMGAVVDELHLYVMEPASLAGPEIDCLLDSPLDAVTLASPSAARAWAALVRGPLAAIAGLPAACIGPTTAEAALAEGLRKVLVAGEHTGAGIVETLVAYFESPEAEGEGSNV